MQLINTLLFSIIGLIFSFVIFIIVFLTLLFSIPAAVGLVFGIVRIKCLFVRGVFLFVHSAELFFGVTFGGGEVRSILLIVAALILCTLSTTLPSFSRST